MGNENWIANRIVDTRDKTRYYSFACVSMCAGSFKYFSSFDAFQMLCSPRTRYLQYLDQLNIRINNNSTRLFVARYFPNLDNLRLIFLQNNHWRICLTMIIQNSIIRRFVPADVRCVYTYLCLIIQLYTDLITYQSKSNSKCSHLNTRQNPSIRDCVKYYTEFYFISLRSLLHHSFSHSLL